MSLEYGERASLLNSCIIFLPFDVENRNSVNLNILYLTVFTIRKTYDYTKQPNIYLWYNIQMAGVRHVER